MPCPCSLGYAPKRAVCSWAGYVIRTLLTPDFQSEWKMGGLLVESKATRKPRFEHVESPLFRVCIKQAFGWLEFAIPAY
tara:strand:- start:10581 stop:10817 length:237 start_codon:yes stop_codon:yes gene_type:complete